MTESNKQQPWKQPEAAVEITPPPIVRTPAQRAADKARRDAEDADDIAFSEACRRIRLGLTRLSDD
jgi:hypothetical protein